MIILMNLMTYLKSQQIKLECTEVRKTGDNLVERGNKNKVLAKFCAIFLPFPFIYLIFEIGFHVAHVGP